MNRPEKQRKIKYYPALTILNNLSRQATGTACVWVNTYKNRCEEQINFTIVKYQETNSSRVFAYSEGISEVHHLVCGWVGRGRGLWHGGVRAGAHSSPIQHTE